MEAHAPNPNPQTMRVLIRPPIQIPPPPPPIPPDLSPPSPSQSSTNGVVVVGFVGRRHDDVAQLINRIIDANVFGSANLDTPFRPGKQLLMSEEIEGWFKSRSLSFYYEGEKGILYLQLSSISCPMMEGVLESQMGFDSVLEDHEFGQLQGLLFMFSVCHVIIFIQEGSRFDTQVLKKFRVLQASKQAMYPFLRSHSIQPLTLNSHASPSTRAPSPVASSNIPTLSQSRGILNRGAGSVTLMSGLGSYPTLLPGQCNPVMLFLFLDDFCDANPNSGLGEQMEASTLSPSSLNNLARPNLPTKGSGSVVVLTRPANKPEDGFRKKLQSSLEAQIRFSIKKCRILSSSENGHTGSRGGGLSSLVPLFLLDASKAVALVDLCSNSKGASLEFATNLLDDVIDWKATSDSLLLESHSQSANNEDILSVKEFILRQCDILRGRGGMVSSSSSGPATGVGMVAVAAAAAAASAASGKTVTAPKLPTFETWLSSSQPILHGILSLKPGCIDEVEICKRKQQQQQNAVLGAVEGNSSKASDSIEVAISFLASGRGLNTKFSTFWCEKALPVAKELYLKELPPSYPSSLHVAHLERALSAFKTMVKGPAVQLYMKKIEDDCTSIWISGRQLCDAVSLTGKPCMHKRHDHESHFPPSREEIKQHSSGYVFLHACACGRSRQLRSDPFDFEMANVTFNVFPECDKLLPALEVPRSSVKGPIKPSCWRLIRVGNARYYNPTKGLLQSGFFGTENFLLKCIIFLGKGKAFYGLSLNDTFSKKNSSYKDESLASKDAKKGDGLQSQSQEVQSGVEIQKGQSLISFKTNDKSISSGGRLSSSTMRKPFSEVVAGSAGTHSAFPPLQTRKQPIIGAGKEIKQHNTRDNGSQKVIETASIHEKVHNDVSVVQEANGVATNVNGSSTGDPVLQIGSNVIQVNMGAADNVTKGFMSPTSAVMFIGFEHECPHGHRFILRPDHLNYLGSHFALSEEPPLASSTENSDHKVGDPLKFGEHDVHVKTRKHSNGIFNTAVHTTKNLEVSKVRSTNKSVFENEIQVSNPHRDKQTSEAKVDPSVLDLGASLQSVSLDEGSALSLLNRKLPIYMNCPHCRGSRRKKDTANVKFAGSISQLQRIFLVTPALPVIVAACPIVQFEESCLPSTVPDRKRKLQFGPGCRVVLPPESFLSLRLPFVYGVELEDGKLHPLTPQEDQPELTAWIIKGTALQVFSEGSNLVQGSFT